MITGNQGSRPVLWFLRTSGQLAISPTLYLQVLSLKKTESMNTGDNPFAQYQDVEWNGNVVQEQLLQEVVDEGCMIRMPFVGQYYGWIYNVVFQTICFPCCWCLVCRWIWIGVHWGHLVVFRSMSQELLNVEQFRQRKSNKINNEYFRQIGTSSWYCWKVLIEWDCLEMIL